MSRDEIIINTIRFLSVDQVEKAKSGHPGMPLGASHILFLIYDRFMKFNPKNPQWINRDRFVLSAGHGSAMLYSLLFVMGYDLTLEDLKSFRQLNSKTPGHPESFLTPGVEATTGPLGQGIGNAVGMALAERYLASLFNREGFPIIDHYTFAVVSDGDLMEGVSCEVGQLAGHLGLHKLVVIWDNNGVSIDGPTSLAWSENVLKRFEAFGWYVDHVEEGYDLEKLEQAIRRALSQKDKPSFISVRTHLAYGSPKQDDASAHGAPLGREAVLETKRRFNWPQEEFYVPEEVWHYREERIRLGEKQEEEWRKLWNQYRENYPQLAQQLERAFRKDWDTSYLEKLPVFTESMATRQASGKTLQVLAEYIPTMLGGSADLSESNNTYLYGKGDMARDNPTGRNIHYGVREHAMGTVMNGMAYHGGILPYGGTFLVFSDYMRPSIRMAALSKLQVIYVFTHDSIGLGEDGPTHQPVEHLSSLRLIPNLWVIRPADANEVPVAWDMAINRKDGPTAIILSRQKLPIIDRTKYASVEGVRRGAYVLADTEGEPDILLMASGSEVHPCLEAKELLEKEGIKVRVINMVSFEVFEEQPISYKEEVLPPSVKKRVAVEAGSPHLWYRYVGEEGLVIGMVSFGKSAPGDVLMREFGFTGEAIANRVKKFLVGV
ncbi:transketolase [Thermocrinis albus DSM 14484]|uniref:Transketolase n=1 Tax=Thermocrinis albus (strain DSM 14484 / JCM 11386 / HI 11/12) TaxID=638303 RepID=D3SMN3_THEAH|nr:transketolase [Thermocrinis albus]ADC90013.1 transketolase [Thermocrinis albus DSM 14484]